MTDIIETFKPLRQASMLLELRSKTEGDVTNVRSMCSHLTTAQILRVLELKSATERLPGNFIRKLKTELQQHRPDPKDEQKKLLMDAGFAFDDVILAFSHSYTKLEDIEVPLNLNLSMLVKV